MKRIACLAVAVFALSAHAEEVIKTGRYTQVENVPPVNQLNPLKVVIKVRLHKDIQTVESAVNYLLFRSGYTLVERDLLSAEAKTLLDLPLPAVHREIGPLTLDHALKSVIGDAFVLVVDPVHRLVGFDVSDRIERIGG